jgi:cytoskeletal protein CcmA (bactofilin family)
MGDTDTKPEGAASLETLETPATEAVKLETNAPVPEPVAPSLKSSKQPNRFKQLSKQVNIYPILFGLVILIAALISLFAYLQSRQSTVTSQLKTQSLSQSTLQQLATSDATVGSNQTILNVQSSAVFAGQVLVRQNLQVAGNIQVGGTLALNNISVAGTGQFGTASISKNLAVGGDTAIQGAATIAKSLQVNGGGTFSGPLSAPQVTTGSLQLNGDLTLTHHFDVGGSLPGHSSGSALGSGGSTSNSGSDTAGSITINTGSSPAAGCFATISFASAYASTPFVLVTPIGSAAGGLSYYVNRSSTSFSICDATPPPGGSSFGFDYFVAG